MLSVLLIFHLLLASLLYDLEDSLLVMCVKITGKVIIVVAIVTCCNRIAMMVSMSHKELPVDCYVRNLNLMIIVSVVQFLMYRDVFRRGFGERVMFDVTTIVLYDDFVTNKRLLISMMRGRDENIHGSRAWLKVIQKPVKSELYRGVKVPHGRSLYIFTKKFLTGLNESQSNSKANRKKRNPRMLKTSHVTAVYGINGKPESHPVYQFRIIRIMSNNLTKLSNDELFRWIIKNNRFKTESLIPSSYLCSKCKQVLIDPIQTDCGCRYCRLCFEEYYSAGNRLCLNELECDNTSLACTTTDDKAASRDVQRIIIKCPFSNCNFLEEVKNIKCHMDQCENYEEKCNLCGNYYSNMEKIKHEIEECPKRQVECSKCMEKMEYEKLITKHNNIESSNLCLKIEGNCPNGCGLVIFHDHKNNCENMPVKCPFIECGEICSKKTINEHLINNNFQHFNTLLETILGNDNEISKLEDNVKRKYEDIRILKDKYDEMKKIQQNINTRLSSLQSSKNKMASSNLSKVIFRKGSFIWKVDNIVQLRGNAENGGELSKFSDPFYSSEFGYKLCIKIYPAGDGVGARSYLSVYFVVMKGEYDELQPWPFRNKVTLSLLSSNKNVTENFKPDSTSACYQRPSDEYNIASGSPKFIKWDDLNKFIIDGSIFIKMVVVPN